MKASRIKSFLLSGLLCVPGALPAQLASVENSLLWEISGNGLKESSYLFGTHHLLGSQYVDTLNNVMSKFEVSDVLVGEIAFDSAQAYKMISAATMPDTTLTELLPKEWYAETEEWLKEISSYPDLSVFDKMKPMMVELILMSMLQQQYSGHTGMPMDIHLQQRAKQQRKDVVGLESLDEQLSILFHSIPLKRQAEMLIEFVRQRHSAGEELQRINQLYRRQNLSALSASSLERYTTQEADQFLKTRNDKWIASIPDIISEHKAFIMVGALHLTGPSGLVKQLRALGYYVTPIPVD
jgi:uncharacterized protein YbaP (TraB family)